MRRWFPDMAQEIARQQRTEELYGELQQAYADLQAVQAARDALANMIVHDMRTPLTSVITGLQIAQQIDDDPDVMHEMLQGAATGAEELLQMVNSLLDINKMESGEMVLHREPVSISSLILRADIVIEPLAREKNIAIEIDAEEAAGTVLVDPDIIWRVFMNLMGNAIKFTPEDGHVRVRASSSPDGGLRVTISDSGPGIPPEHQARIFEKFYQVPIEGGGKAPSTGLGLTFCKLAVEAHGGQIGVESEPGSGSTFWFTLPESPQSGR